MHPTDDRDELLAELARLRAVERVALDFCARCERGEIRSARTYARFRSALASGGGVAGAPDRPAPAGPSEHDADREARDQRVRHVASSLRLEDALHVGLQPQPARE